MSVLPRNGWVTVGKLPNLSVPLFLIYKMGMRTPVSIPTEFPKEADVISGVEYLA